MLTGALTPAAPVLAAGPTRPYVVVYDSRPREAFPVQAETVARERRYGFHSTHRFRHALDGFAARLTPEEARALRADPEVALVTPDRTVRAARVPLASGEAVPTGVNRIGALQGQTVHGPSAAAVAVLDSGIDLSNPDLSARAGHNCIAPGQPPEDDNADSHGTMVAGVIGARNNGAGLVGVAPGTELYAVKVLDVLGEGLVSQVVCGIDWTTAYGPGLGVRVVNVSLSVPFQHEPPLEWAIHGSARSGLVYVAAAGNTGIDLASEIPAAYPDVLVATAAADSDGTPGAAGPSCDGEADDTAATFSNYATRPADDSRVVAAPGMCIGSTARGGGVGTFSGTSAAAPHVSGVVALCMGEPGRPGPCADMTPTEVIEQLRADAAANASPQNGFLGDPFSPIAGRFYGHLVSAHDPTVRRIPARPPPPLAAAAAPAADSRVEVLAIRIRRRQDVDELAVTVRVAEPATIVARARVRLRGGAARVIRSRTTRAQVAANEQRRLRLRLPRAGLRQVKRALRRGRRVRARVNVTVTDAASNSRSTQRRVRLRP